MASSEEILTFSADPTLSSTTLQEAVYRVLVLCEPDWKSDGIPREVIVQSSCIAVRFTERKRNIWDKKGPYRFLLFRGALWNENGLVEIDASVHN
jgi:hypothetical protein